MSRSKYIDKICIFAVILAIIISGIFGSQVLSEKTHRKLGYENLLFDTSKVHTINIQIDNWDEFIKNADAKKYYNCNVTIDGETFENIAIRTKGGSSLEDVSAAKGTRYSFKLEFDHNDKGVTYHGLDKLNLNNMIYDTTYMKDFITYQMMSKMDVATPLTSYSYITVNDSDFGLYLNIEGIEDSFMKRNYGTTFGKLYKPENSGGDEELEDDFNFEKIDWNALSDEEIMAMAEDEATDATCLKYIDDKISSYSEIFDTAKTKLTKADKKRLIQSLKILNSGKNVSSAVDTESVIKYFVIHNFVSNDDGYTSSSVHNYYLYEKDGKMSMIPWDYNLAYGTMGTHNESEVINQSIDSLLTGEDISTRPMFGWIISDNKYKKIYHRYYQQFITSTIDSGEIEKLIDDTAVMLKPYIEKDPTKFYTADTFPIGINALKNYFTLRSQKVKNELSGDTTMIDTSTFKLEELGTDGSEDE